MVDKTVGNMIRSIRTTQNLSQTDLARLTGLANSTICDIERGRANASLRVLKRVACALQTPVAVFFSDTSSENNVKPTGTD